MPPKSVGSALFLIALSSMTAIEAGGCDKRPETLSSVTRSALPLLVPAMNPVAPRTNYALSDYGLHSRPDLRHVCGHYELRADGKLTTWDLFVTPSDVSQLKREVERELRSPDTGLGRAAGRNVNVVVESTSRFVWPRGCPRIDTAKTQGVLVATRVL